jgi:hypothetical protein
MKNNILKKIAHTTESHFGMNDFSTLLGCITHTHSTFFPFLFNNLSIGLVTFFPYIIYESSLSKIVIRVE